MIAYMVVYDYKFNIYFFMSTIVLNRMISFDPQGIYEIYFLFDKKKYNKKKNT